MVFDQEGRLLYRAAQFQEELFVLDLSLGAAAGADLVAVASWRGDRGDRLPPPEVTARLEPDAEVYSALVTGLRDYARKNGFSQVVLGLSGGIDSALTATIAVDALGPDAVWAVTMPSRYSSSGSVDDSRELAQRLRCRFSVLPIDEVFTAYLEALAEPFEGSAAGTAEENLQARIRGAILMALSNRFGHLVLTTANKSETAVGYATLYGDMAGGFSVLKDLFKGLVYRLAHWRNLHHDLIPQQILDKPPSAELRPGQLDTDALPPYPVLDPILECYVEQALSVDAIVKQGFDRETVTRVTRLVDANEYKRRQAPPGVRISPRAFGKDRRLPITNRYNPSTRSSEGIR
jgi:NAD+ synthase (glutamine-hydrolysing)